MFIYSFYFAEFLTEENIYVDKRCCSGLAWHRVKDPLNAVVPPRNRAFSRFEFTNLQQLFTFIFVTIPTSINRDR